MTTAVTVTMRFQKATTQLASDQQFSAFLPMMDESLVAIEESVKAHLLKFVISSESCEWLCGFSGFSGYWNFSPQLGQYRDS